MQSYIDLARSAPRLDEQEELRLIAACQERDDQEALTRIVSSHMPMIVGMAKRMPTGALVEDMISEGVLGLMQAVQRFDPSMNRRLNVLARARIQGAMSNHALNNISSVKAVVSRNHRKVLMHMREAMKADPDDRIMTETEARRVATEIGVETEDVRYVMNRFSASDVSLDADAGADGEGGSLSETMADVGQSLEDAVIEGNERAWRSTKMRRAIAALPERDRAIFIGRRVEEPPLSLEHLAEVHGISKARVNQVADAAFEKVKRSVEEELAARPAPAPPRDPAVARGIPARGPDMPRRSGSR